MSQKKRRKVGVAVVGLGFMGATHLRAYQKIAGARVVAVGGANRLPKNGVLRGVAGNIKTGGDLRLGSNVKVYTDFKELLANPEVELVDICTPTPLHAAQTIAALKAGKHVLCEKPLARTSAEAKKILRVAARSAKFLMPAMCLRFWPGWNELKQIVAQKTYGEVLAAHFRRVSEMPAWSAARAYDRRDSGGALFDLHIHDTDFVQFLFGRPQNFFSTGHIARNGSIHHVVTQYTFRHGPIVHAEGSWLHTGGFNMAFSVNCERATLRFDFAHGGKLELAEKGKPPRVLPIANTDGYTLEIKYFVDCITRGERPKIVTPQDALSALQTCEAEEKSIRQGVPVKGSGIVW